MDKVTQKELLTIVKENYEAISEQFSESRKKYLWPEMIKLAKLVKPGERVLDVGCGSGRLTEAFLGKNVEYLGVDSCRSLIDIAAKEYPDHRFLVGDILGLGRTPEIDFNYVFCVAVLQHIPTKKLRVEALRQLRNKIVLNGRIIIVVWNMWSNSKVNEKHGFKKLIYKFALLKLIKKNKMDLGDIVFDWKNPQGEKISKRYYHAFTKQELIKIVKKANLKVEKSYKDKFNYYMVLKK